MTTQEFVKQEVNKISKESTLHGSKLFSDGLTKGLEIAKELIMSISGCKEQTAIKYIEDSLTEKYGNNG